MRFELSTPNMLLTPAWDKIYDAQTFLYRLDSVFIAVPLDGFGGYNYSGVWLRYSSNGYVSYTGKSGGGGQYAECNSGYNLYGDNQDLESVGCV